MARGTPLVCYHVYLRLLPPERLIYIYGIWYIIYTSYKYKILQYVEVCKTHTQGTVYIEYHRREVVVVLCTSYEVPRMGSMRLEGGIYNSSNALSLLPRLLPTDKCK